MMVAATFYMMKDISLTDWKTIMLNLIVVVGTWLLLSYSRLPSPIIVLFCLTLGWIF
jgi:chromate transporter